MILRFIILVSMVLSIYSCKTMSGRSGMTDANSPPPGKPGDLPISSVSFVPNDMASIQDHGNSMCKIVAKLNSEELTRLSHKICEDEAKWLGYSTADGMKTNNELFIANRSALRDVINKASAIATKNGSVAIQRLVFVESRLFEQDLSLLVGEKIKRFENEMENVAGTSNERREVYRQFVGWVGKLNEYYQMHDVENKT